MKNLFIFFILFVGFTLSAQSLKYGATKVDSFKLIQSTWTGMGNKDGAEGLWLKDTLWNLNGWIGGSTSIDSIYYSVDTGKTWIFTNLFIGGARHSYGLTNNNGTYYIVGKDAFSSPIGFADVYQMGNSPRRWTLVNGSPAFGNRIFQQLVSLNGYMYLLGGQNTYLGASPTIFRDIWRSTNGVTWTQQCASCAPNIGNTSGTATVWRGRIWVVAGEYYADTHVRYNTVYSSSDGVTWVAHQNLPISGISYPKVFVWDGKLWVYGGFGTANTSTLLYTIDGTTTASWKSASYIGVKQTHAAAIAFQASTFFSVTSGNWQSGTDPINKTRQKVIKIN